MSLFEDTNPRELKELLGQIHSRESALPDFQRDFVWDPSATQELVVSIASNYPAGSLLRLRNTRDFFAAREIQGAPVLDGYKPTFLVLDGQQRLTSLYQAFFGVGEHRYFLSLEALLGDADFEEAIFHLRANTRRAHRLEDFGLQAKELVLPLSVLKRGSGGFGKWSRKVARSLSGKEREKLEDALDKIEERWIQTIDDYCFPVVTLSDETEADAVCTIFETLNRTGVKLSPFELLTARFWPKNVNLRALWEQAQVDEPIVADFLIDPYYILQIIALASRSSPSCKRGDVLNLKVKDIEKWWDRAVGGLAKGLEILRDDCGVIIPKWLPYQSMVITIGAFVAKNPLPGSAAAGATGERLQRWFWCSVLGQTYDNAANSQSARDLTELERWSKGGELPESVSALKFDPYILRATTPRQRAIYRGVVCLVLRNNPRDFHNGDRITGDLIVENHIDDHHIFPQGFLNENRPDLPARLRDSVLNRTLIDRKTKYRISKKPPSEYMEEIYNALDEKPFYRLLRSHLLPGDEESPLWGDDFDGFWTGDRKRSGAKLRKLLEFARSLRSWRMTRQNEPTCACGHRGAPSFKCTAWPLLLHRYA